MVGIEIDCLCTFQIKLNLVEISLKNYFRNYKEMSVKAVKNAVLISKNMNDSKRNQYADIVHSLCYAEKLDYKSQNFYFNHFFREFFFSSLISCFC